jgi:hypothetical protein
MPVYSQWNTLIEEQKFWVLIEEQKFWVLFIVCMAVTFKRSFILYVTLVVAR